MNCCIQFNFQSCFYYEQGIEDVYIEILKYIYTDSSVTVHLHNGVNIDGEFLSNLRFADDIFLCTETPQE